ncbi:MAG: DUF2341 domain-containing protein, partial [Methanophagales archaeon]|nr:DUF2341 domain-containing protein [Methanophagales archaeon]
MNGKLFAAVSIIVLICASLVSAYTGGSVNVSVNVSGNATNNSSPVPVTNADTDTDTNTDTNNMSEPVLNDSSVDNNSPFSFSDQNTSSNTSSNVIHGGNAVAENYTNVTSEAAAEAESEGNRSSGQTNTDNKTDTDTETDTETVLGAMPDLVVTAIETPGSLCPNSSNEIKVTVANIGEQDITTPTPFYVSLKANETVIDSRSINVTLPAAGEPVTINFSWTPPNTGSGSYTLTAVADSENTLSESNETNNWYTISVTINETINKESRPDLIIEDIQTPDKVYSNVSNTITATIENIGNANTSVFKVAFSLNDTDTALCLKTVNALPVATTTTLSFDWTPVHAGNYTINVIADPENETIELNDSNNIKTINITVFGVSQTDLKVVKFETAATEPFFAGELNLIKARIKNVGRDAGSFEVSLHVNETETPVDTERIPSLAFNTETVVTFGWVPESEGDYRLNITVDANNELIEENETNNHEEINVHVRPAPSWHYEQNITVENPLNCTLHDYPVLLRLDPSIFNYSEVRHGGEDISFKVGVGCEPIPYWIERWNRSGESLIWLRLEEIPPGRHRLKMYWNASAPDIPSRSDGHLIFDLFDDFECAECFNSWSRDCIRYGVDKACNFSLFSDTPDNSSYSAKITAHRWADCIGILHKNVSIVQPRLEFWMRTEGKRNEKLRAGALAGNISADDFERVFETENVTDWRLVSVNLSEFVGRNTDLGFFAANNWWNYNVSSFVDNVRLRKCAGAEREPFVDFGLAELASTNITPRFRNLYAVFPNQIYVNVTNNGTADARNLLVYLNASYSDEEG